MTAPRLACALAMLLAGCASSKPADLYRVSERSAIEAAARRIIAADRNAALVTLDDNGQPRVRTVFTSEPDAAMTVWIATRPATRKVGQIRKNPLVTLYYSDDSALAYVSIMGRAILHTDEATLRAKNPFDSERTRMFFPDFPKDCLLIEVRPQWIEATGQGIEASADTWRPQAIPLRPCPPASAHGRCGKCWPHLNGASQRGRRLRRPDQRGIPIGNVDGEEPAQVLLRSSVDG